MGARLGVETVKMEDDGGISLAINVKKGFQPVVLSVEVPFQFSSVDI
jgi:hypothetical protein